MIVLRTVDAVLRTAKVVLLFGTGLVGGAILRSLPVLPGASAEELHWDWSKPRIGGEDHVRHAVRDAIEATNAAEIAVVWAAGKSGFGSDDAVMAKEYEALHRVTEFARSLEPITARKMDRSFHFISSAGGLFEGQRSCTKDAVPRPLRAYGRGKVAQERLISSDPQLGRRRIYRPSSVYGFEPKGRMNLVSALVRSALRQSPVNITGSLTTQRDYILASDIGRFIADEITGGGPTPLEHHMLVSGRPASIFEIIGLTERQFGSRLLLRIDPDPANSLDISFHRSALPNGFAPTTLEEGVARVALLSSNHSFASR